jgi:hypothetical protein
VREMETRKRARGRPELETCPSTNCPRRRLWACAGPLARAAIELAHVAASRRQDRILCGGGSGGSGGDGGGGGRAGCSDVDDELAEEVQGGGEGRAHDGARWREDRRARGADAVAQGREAELDGAADGACVGVVVRVGAGCGRVAGGLKGAVPWFGVVMRACIAPAGASLKDLEDLCAVNGTLFDQLSD